MFSTEMYADRADEIISSHNSSKPLFLMVAFQVQSEWFWWHSSLGDQGLNVMIIGEIILMSVGSIHLSHSHNIIHDDNHCNALSWSRWFDFRPPTILSTGHHGNICSLTGLSPIDYHNVDDLLIKCCCILHLPLQGIILDLMVCWMS